MADVIIGARRGEYAFSPIFAGFEQCAPGHRYGPHIRSYYLIHFCLGGAGVLRDRHGTHEIQKGELFVIRPGEVTVYEADVNQPWRYAWIAFRGKEAVAFEGADSVYSVPSELAQRLYTLVQRGEQAPELYIALLYELLYHLFSTQSKPERGETRVEEICRYIQYNYMNELRVSALARAFGFERSYLYRLFREKLGMSVKGYITEVRMQHAKRFLEQGYTVGDSARMVGYEDALCFSHAFHRYYGCAPRAVRIKK